MIFKMHKVERQQSCVRHIVTDHSHPISFDSLLKDCIDI